MYQFYEVVKSHLIADTVEDVVDRVEPGGSLPDGADRLAVHGHCEGLGAVGVEGGAAAALAGERSVEPDDLAVGLVAQRHVEGPHVAAPEPVAEPGVLLGPVENLLPGPGDGEPVLLLAASEDLAGLNLLFDHQLPAGLERTQTGQHSVVVTVVGVENSPTASEVDLLGAKTRSGLCSDGRHFLEGRQQVGSGATVTQSLSHSNRPQATPHSHWLPHGLCG